MKIQFLGCGSTYGVPTAGGDWGYCDPTNKNNERLRPSVLLTVGDKNILIDIGPDFREQTCRYDVKKIDAILITHHHMDHINGIADLPRYLMAMPNDIEIYCSPETMDGIKKTFYYFFENDNKITYFGKARVKWHVFDPESDFKVQKINVTPMIQEHGHMKTIGFRIDDFSYNIDLKTMPEQSFRKLQGIKTWVLDCDNPEPSDSHMDPETVKQWVEKINPDVTYITHLDEDMDYETQSENFPENIKLAYDGMEIICEDS